MPGHPFAGHRRYHGGPGLDDLRICATGMGELDHPESPVSEHDN
jgi:hypothetical protein